MFTKLHMEKALQEYYGWWEDKGEAARERVEKNQAERAAKSPLPNTTK